MTVGRHNYTTTMSYTSGSRLYSILYPSGQNVSYTRNALGKIQSVTSVYDNVQRTLVDNVAYNPFGAASTLDFANGGSVENVASECGCTYVANPGEQTEHTFTYDSNGNVTSVQGANVDWFDAEYTYDAQQRLTKATGWFGEYLLHIRRCRQPPVPENG